jgi:hypothetical protein
MRRQGRDLSKSQLIKLIRLRQLQITALGQAIDAAGFQIKILPDHTYALIAKESAECLPTPTSAPDVTSSFVSSAE